MNNHTPHDTLEIKAIFSSRHRGFFNKKGLFKIKFKFGDLTSVNIFRKINLRIKNIIKKKIISILFLIPILLKQLFTFRIFRPDAEARRVRRAYYEERKLFGINWSSQEIPLRIINTKLTFKSDDCVICLTNSPKVLFWNCRHLCMCEECDKVASLNTCPVCKTETTIKRNI